MTTRKLLTVEQILNETKNQISEHVKQREIYEREYKLSKNLLDATKIEYTKNVTQQEQHNS